MVKYFKKFKKHSDYNTYITSQDKILPNVSYCELENEVHFNKLSYADNYLTFITLEDGTFTFTMSQKLSTSAVPSISYSIDNGKTWVTTQNVDNQEVIITTPTINAGDKILWKSNAVQYCTNPNPYPNGDEGYGYFFSSGNFNIEGNIMSLMYEDDFKGRTTLKELISTGAMAGSFSNLFKNSTKLVSVKNLSLPATTLEQYCYYYMFYGCTSLTSTPTLPATTLASSCYNSMFKGCTSLTTPPKLPATTLAGSCYGGMFQGCTSLTTAPKLLTTTLEQYCYYSMFQDCTSLTTAPELPATTLANSCYYYMFNGCTSLTSAPTLPATTLAERCYHGMFDGCTSLVSTPTLPITTLTNYCYSNMFNGCTALTTPPELPATTLANNCYEYMFSGCTSLTTAPELPAITLVQNCYRYMFNGCTSLNYIKAMFTTTPSTTYTQNWVQNVASSGTFVKNSSA